MAKKYKLTGCSRFLIFFLILAPIIFFGVTYFQGENPIDTIKKAIPENIKYEKKSTVSDDAIIQGSIEAQKQQILDLTKKVNRLEEVIIERNAEIRRLKSVN